jgi:carboxymethylenebutenolidase
MSPSQRGDVTIPVAGYAPLTAYHHAPPAPTRGVVVVHELFGRSPEVDGAADRLAAAGFAAVVPDLFGNRSKPLCVARALRAIHSGQGEGIEQILAARDWLKQTHRLGADALGVIGFCLGGGFALAVGKGFAAVSTNYGDIPSTDVLRGTRAVVGCYGTRDAVFGGNGRKLQKALEPLGVVPEIHTVEGAGHAFLLNGHHPVAAALTRPFIHVEYNAALAEGAWTRILAFFDRNLAAAAPAGAA